MGLNLTEDELLGGLCDFKVTSTLVVLVLPWSDRTDGFGGFSSFFDAPAAPTLRSVCVCVCECKGESVCERERFEAFPYPKV